MRFPRGEVTARGEHARARAVTVFRRGLSVEHKARHVYWLNPEPKSYWDTGDSIVGDYGVHCDGVYECRNLRQLEKFVDLLA